MPHLLTFTGPSLAGKSTTVDFFLGAQTEHFQPVLVPKYTTRPKRKNEGREVRCVKELPRSCNLVYEQYGVRYGLPMRRLFDLLAKGKSPIIILNDVRTVEDVRAALGGLVRSIFIFRESPSRERFATLAESRGSELSEYERRFQKAQAIYRIYIENIHLFDHVIMNTGTRDDLHIQVLQVIRGLSEKENWPLR